jgi:hypothetical protein
MMLGWVGVKIGVKDGGQVGWLPVRFTGQENSVRPDKRHNSVPWPGKGHSDAMKMCRRQGYFYARLTPSRISAK